MVFQILDSFNLVVPSFTIVKMTVKSINWALQIHYLVVRYLREGKSDVNV